MPKPRLPKKRENIYRPSSHKAILIGIASKLYINHEFTLDMCEDVTGVPKGTIGRVASEAHWLEKKKMVQEKALQNVQGYDAGYTATDKALIKSEENWAEKGKLHRHKMDKIAGKLLKEAETMAEKGLIPIEGIKDIEVLDKIQRRNTGLESEEGTKTTVAINLGPWQKSQEKVIDVTPEE